MRILCLISPWTSELFKEIVNSIDGVEKVIYLSDFLKLDQTGLTKNYYKLWKDSSYESKFDSELIQIIKGCRLLRSLSFEESVRRASMKRDLIAKLVESEKPDLCLSETTDQYLKDILFRECLKRGIPSIGLVRSFLNGYTRVTVRGEIQKVRSVDDDEANEVIKMLLQNDYLPNFIHKSKKRKAHLIEFERQIKKVLRVVYYYFKIKISGEYHNYHYLASSMPSLLEAFIALTKWPLKISAPKYTQNFREFKNKKLIFVPLQFFPEATTDYWGPENIFPQYPATMKSLLKSISSDFLIIAKEHPGAVGFRGNQFYNSLSSIKTLKFAEPHVPAIELVEQADAVIVWTGSVGFEAMLRGKPVISFAEPYYAKGRLFKKFTNAGNHLNELSQHLKNALTKNNQKKKGGI